MNSRAALRLGGDDELVAAIANVSIDGTEITGDLSMSAIARVPIAPFF